MSRRCRDTFVVGRGGALAARLTCDATTEVTDDLFKNESRRSQPDSDLRTSAMDSVIDVHSQNYFFEVFC